MVSCPLCTEVDDDGDTSFSEVFGWGLKIFDFIATREYAVEGAADDPVSNGLARESSSSFV